MALLFTFPQVLIHSAELSYEDDSLMKRVLNLVAEEDGKDVDTIIKEIITEIDSEIEKEEDAFSRKTMEAFKEFIKNPERISISIAPEEPLPVRHLQGVKDRKEAFKLLNVKVSS